MTCVLTGKRRAQRRWRTAVTLGLFLFLGLTSATWAQSTPDSAKHATADLGEIRGRIVAIGTGQAVTTGSISVRRASDTSFVVGALADSDGSFHVVGIEPGRYAIRVRAAWTLRVDVSNVRSSAQAPAAAAGRTPGRAPTRATVTPGTTDLQAEAS
jgi:hypothetical protein